MSNSSKYVYNYFNGQGRGEAVRWIFALGGQEFVDNRIKVEDWPTVKPITPFGTLPYLEVDGKALGESLTIQRFLARRFGLVGDDAWQEAKVDEIVDYVTDSRKTYPQWVDAAFFDGEPEKAEQIKADYMKKAPIPLEKIQSLLGNNEKGQGFFIGKRVSWADVSVTCYLDTMERFSPGFLNQYPLLKAYRARIHALPVIAEWLKKRPNTPW